MKQSFRGSKEEVMRMAWLEEMIAGFRTGGWNTNNGRYGGETVGRSKRDMQEFMKIKREKISG